MACSFKRRSADDEALYRRYMVGYTTGNWEGIWEGDHTQKPFVITKREYEDHQKPIFACSFKPCWGDRVDAPAILATVGDNRLTVYECPIDDHVLEPVLLWTDTSPKPQTARDHGKPLEYDQYYTVEWVADHHEKEEFIVYGGESASIRVVSYTRGAYSHSMHGHGHIINEIKRHPNEPLIFASASRDGTVRIWNVRLPFPLAQILNSEGVLDQVLSLDWSWDGMFIVTGSMDHHIRVWRIIEKLEKRIETTAADNFNLFTSKKSEKRFPRLMGPGSVIYEVEEPIFIQMPCCETSDIHLDYVDCVRVFGNFIISKSVQNEIRVWKFGDFREPFEGDAGKFAYNMPVDLENGVETQASLLITLACPMSNIWFCKFNLDPRRRIIPAGNRNGELRFYRFDQFDQVQLYETLREMHKVRVSNACIRDIAFEFFGRILVAVADDGSVTRLDRFEKGMAEPPDDVGPPLTEKQIDLLIRRGITSKISGRTPRLSQVPDENTKTAQYEKWLLSSMPRNAEEAGALARRFAALHKSNKKGATKKQRRQLKRERKRARKEQKAKKEKVKQQTKEELEAAKAAAKEAADRARKNRANNREMQRIIDEDRDPEEGYGDKRPLTPKQPETNSTESKQRSSHAAASTSSGRMTEATHTESAAEIRARILECYNYEQLRRAHPPPSLEDEVERLRKRLQSSADAAKSSDH